MSNIPERWDDESQWYFVTAVTNNRVPIFTTNKNIQCLLKAILETKQYYMFRLGALVILPDHWHALIEPEQNKGIVIEKVVGSFKRNFTKQFTKRKNIWQPRFLDHRIRDWKDFSEYQNYIRINPVKHKLSQNSEDYPWCYIHDKPFSNDFIELL